MPAPDHVLVVDDDAEIRTLLSEYLQRNGYRVSAAADGKGMWSALEAKNPDIVVLDLMMPGDDGLTLCRNLRARSSIPVVMLTARGDETDRIVGLEMGADDYLAKPFNPRELLARIKSVLRRTRSLPGNLAPVEARLMRFAGWTLDLHARHLIAPDAVVVPLSGVEFKLLGAFLAHPNTVLTRDQLIDLMHVARCRAFRSCDRRTGEQVEAAAARRRETTHAHQDGTRRRLRAGRSRRSGAVMRLVPRSLFSRLVLVLMAGLVVAQVLSLAIHAHERGRLLAQASGMQSAQRIADIVNVLEPLAPAERRRLAAVLSAPPLLIRLDEAPRPPPRDDAESRTHAAFFASLLRRHLGDQREVSVTVTDSVPWKSAVRMHGPEGWVMHGGRMGPGAAYGSHPGLSFVATVRLRDGTLVEFDTRQPEETLTWPYRVLGSVAILLVGVIALSLLAVRWLTRPLATLADAAERLGTNIHRTPLAETGPLEVERAARAFNTMQAKLIGYLRERTQILAAMSHDLKTPITRLRLRAEMLQDAQLRAKFDQDLAEMETMVGRTLDFMRGVDAGEPVQAIDIDALVQSLQRDAQETGHEVAIEGAARAPYPGRPQALKRCLGNLLDNAVKYGRSACIAIDDDEGRLEIRVSDRGPGIPAASLERVFEPFYRLDESRNRDTGGTGLGLEHRAQHRRSARRLAHARKPPRRWARSGSQVAEALIQIKQCSAGVRNDGLREYPRALAKGERHACQQSRTGPDRSKSSRSGRRMGTELLVRQIQRHPQRASRLRARGRPTHRGR